MSMKNNSLIIVGSNNVSVEEKSSKIRSKQPQLTLCYLPEDVARLIFTRLNWVDRVHFCAASKNFSSLLHDISCPSIDKFPWLLFFSSRGTCSVSMGLRDPSSKRKYSFWIMEEEAMEHLLGAKICCSNHGWVLLSREASTINGMYRRFSLYTPFGNNFIRLPKLECHNYEDDTDKVTFSMDPNSHQCVFSICYDKSRHAVNINMCHISDGKNNDNDNKWKNLKFVLPANVMNVKVIEHVMYVDGFVYCVFDAGHELGIFGVVLQEWKFFWDCMPHPNPDDLGPYIRSRKYLPYYCLVAFKGELFLYGHLVSYMVWRFDKSLKQWVQQNSLGDLALFVLYPTILLVEALGELSLYANTVHHLSLSEIKYELFSGLRLKGHRSFRIIFGRPRKSILYNYRGPSHDDDSMEYCWIQPPLLITRN